MLGQGDKSIGNKFQRSLRRRMTDAERVLWRILRDRQFSSLKFRRQHPFGIYTLDYVCLEKRLVIEIDGGQHTVQAEHDEQRTKFLESSGFTVVRFWNHEVLKDTEAVKERIWEVVADMEPHPHPDPLLEGEGGWRKQNK